MLFGLLMQTLGPVDSYSSDNEVLGKSGAMCFKYGNINETLHEGLLGGSPVSMCALPSSVISTSPAGTATTFVNAVFGSYQAWDKTRM